MSPFTDSFITAGKDYFGIVNIEYENGLHYTMLVFLFSQRKGKCKGTEIFHAKSLQTGNRNVELNQLHNHKVY